MKQLKQAQLIIYDSLSRAPTTFVPVHEGIASVYTCGPTVYSPAHLGNLRAYIFADTLTRVLRWKGYEVKHVVNITDVGHLESDGDDGEDKIEQTARRDNLSAGQVAEFYTAAFFKDLANLNIVAPHFVKATDHINDMVQLAAKIASSGFAYTLEDGLYFDTSRLDGYGRLASMVKGEGKSRVVSTGKRNPADFALWRKSPKDRQRMMEWNSPWGRGTPGWHIECSAMSLRWLGKTFDIHTGGVDHREVHHPNEMAQNEAATGGSGARYWMHNEFLNIAGLSKMGKSKGNAILLNNLINNGAHPLVFRYFVHGARYRSQLELTADALRSAHLAFTRLVRRVSELREELGSTGISVKPENLSQEARAIYEQFDQAVSDDLNMPRALMILLDVLANRSVSVAEKLGLVSEFDTVLGLNLLKLSLSDLNIRPKSATLTQSEVVQFLAARTLARTTGDYQRADAIRNQLADIEISDAADATSWLWRPDFAGVMV